MNRKLFPLLSLIIVCALLLTVAGCRNRGGQKQGVRPRTLRDVPAQRLAYSFTPDVDAPPRAAENNGELLPSIQNDFTTKRTEEALLRTALSPDRQRALAIYATGADQPNEFRIDLYGADGNFLRHITPSGLAVVFAPAVSWSPDGNYVAFIAYKSESPQPTPTPLEELLPEVFPSPIASPSTPPGVGQTLPLFSTEQIYICNRDGFDLKPLTTREGLIYFYLSWSPDSQQLAALACRENEWRERPLLPAGRPRLIGLNGSERLLDDAMTDVLPVWSPDASKVATAFETNVRIYDTLGETPTQASINLREPLLAASRVYDEKEAQKGKTSTDGKEAATDKLPVSFNPIVTLEWPQPESLSVQTGFVRNFENEQIRNFMRWHALRLSAQAALLG
jgi:WD40-like Beta Propeller Repeat.